MITPTRPNRQETGQSMVEFALTVIVLVTLLFGVFDFGRAVYYYNAISFAAREAARQAIYCGGDSDTNCSSQDSTTKSEVVSKLAGVPLTTSNITITPSTRQYGDTITVTISM